MTEQEMKILAIISQAMARMTKEDKKCLLAFIEGLAFMAEKPAS